MSERVVVHIPFGQHVPGHRLLLSQPHDPPRKRAPDPAWWAARAELMRRVALPSIQRQTCPPDVVAATFAEQDLDVSAPVRGAVSELGFDTLVGDPRETIARRIGSCDWVLIVHLDSDDAYAPRAIGLMRSVSPARGRVVVLMHGHALEAGTGSICRYGHEQKCPPFFGVWAPGDALATADSWAAYVAECGSPKNHVRLDECPGAVLLSNPGAYLVTLHATNTRSGQAHPGTLQYLGRISLAGEAAEVRSRFGMEGGA